MFVRWITDIYQRAYVQFVYPDIEQWLTIIWDIRSSEVLPYLMGYIVNLTLIMDQLFLYTLAPQPPRHLTQEHIQMALETYERTAAQRVHRQIREYANTATLAHTLDANNARQKVEELIRQCHGGQPKL